MSECITIKIATEVFVNRYLPLKNKTTSTAAAYAADMKIFLEYLSTQYPHIVYVNALIKTHILDYFYHLDSLVKTKKYKRSTVDRKMDCLLTFFRFLSEDGYINNNFMEDYTFNRVRRQYRPDLDQEFNPYVLSQDEIQKLLKTISDSTDKNKYRDYMIFQMLIEFGCRRSTVLSSNWEDYNFKNHEMKLRHQKDKKITTVRITNNFQVTSINSFFVANVKSGKVFLSNKGTPLSNSAFSQVIKKWVKCAGLSEQITSHSFRHTFITNAINANISEEKIIRYTGTTKDALKPYYNCKPGDLSDCISLVNVPAMVI